MKQILVMMAAVVVFVGCGTTKLDPIVEREIREQARSPSSSLWSRPGTPEAKRKQTGKLTNADLAKIKGLSLNNTKITDAGLKDLVKLRNLTSLNLRDTQITDEGLKEVAKLQNLTNLELRNNKIITDEGLKEVAKLQKLKFLGLIHTNITDEGYKELAKLPNLLSLGLAGSKGTKEGVLRLRKALPNTLISMP